MCIYFLAGPVGAAGSGGGLASLAATLPIPPQCQLVADYIVGGSSAAAIGTSASGATGSYQQSTTGGGGGAAVTEQ